MSILLNIVILQSLALAGSEAPSVGLHQAVSAGDAPSVRLELGKGADPNRKNPDNLTPLHVAARQGHLDIARLLLEKGSDPNRRQDTTARTPLHLAVEHQHEEVAKLLLEQGANPNLVARYAKGKTLVPLQLAAGGSDGEIAWLLLGTHPYCKGLAGGAANRGPANLWRAGRFSGSTGKLSDRLRPRGNRRQHSLGASQIQGCSGGKAWPDQPERKQVVELSAVRNKNHSGFRPMSRQPRTPSFSSASGSTPPRCGPDATMSAPAAGLGDLSADPE